MFAVAIASEDARPRLGVQALVRRRSPPGRTPMAAGRSASPPRRPVREAVARQARPASSRRCSRASSAAGSGRRATTTGSTKCSCRWSTYSIMRSSEVAADGDVVEHRRGAARTRTGRRRRRAGRPARRTSRPAAAREHLVDAAEPAGVDLAEADRAGLQELLEDDAVLARARRWRRRSGAIAARDRARGRATSSGLVGSSIQYGSNGASARIQSIASADVPDLVGVDHQHAVRADLLAHDRAAGGCRRSQVAADLHLEVRRSPSATASRQRRRILSSA